MVWQELLNIAQLAHLRHCPLWLVPLSKKPNCPFIERICLKILWWLIIQSSSTVQTPIPIILLKWLQMFLLLVIWWTLCLFLAMKTLPLYALLLLAFIFFYLVSIFGNNNWSNICSISCRHTSVWLYLRVHVRTIFKWIHMFGCLPCACLSTTTYAWLAIN